MSSAMQQERVPAKTAPAFTATQPADACEVQAEKAAASVANGHSAHPTREAIGGYVWLKATNMSHPKSVLNGKALAEVKYEVQVRTPNGRIVDRPHVEFNDVAVPGTAVTRNRPGYTISAPFEGGGTP
jgi:hypothetical protein